MTTCTVVFPVLVGLGFLSLPCPDLLSLQLLNRVFALGVESQLSNLVNAGVQSDCPHRWVPGVCGQASPPPPPGCGRCVWGNHG